MESFRMRFIVGQISDDELQALQKGLAVISKLLLVDEDYKFFRYKVGDEIEAETHDGNRIWTIIRSMEVVEDGEQVVVILTLIARE